MNETLLDAVERKELMQEMEQAAESSNIIQQRWHQLDEVYLKPLFGGHPRSTSAQIAPTTTIPEQ